MYAKRRQGNDKSLPVSRRIRANFDLCEWNGDVENGELFTYGTLFTFWSRRIIFLRQKSRCVTEFNKAKLRSVRIGINENFIESKKTSDLSLSKMFQGILIRNLECFLSAQYAKKSCNLRKSQGCSGGSVKEKNKNTK